MSTPADTPPEDIRAIYASAHRRGLKGVTVFREGCKGVAVFTRGAGVVEVSGDEAGDCGQLVCG